MDAPAVNSAANWIGTWLIEEGKYLYDVKDQVQHLQAELECMIGLLRDSDEAQAQLVDQEGDLQLAIFVKKIRQIAFQAEDVIDTYIFQIASKSRGKPLLTRCACFLFNTPLIRHTGTQIEAIIKDAKDANERLNRYRTSNNNTAKSTSIMLETYAHTDDETVVGFDHHIQTLVEQLRDESSESWVVGIVGTGGAGKSTLARKVYNHLDISNYFTTRAWISISQQWDRKDVLFELLRNTRGIKDQSERSIVWSEKELVEMIYEFLKDQRYLLVLDDIWETKAWDAIRDALLPPARGKGKGSKVIITTRILKVPTYADANCFVLEPQLLDDEQGWELFRKIAIHGRNGASNDITNYEFLGRKMVSKCGGLPLALVTLAGLLREQQSSDDWEHINKACGDNILEHGGVDKIIALSYFSLPAHLKPCFLYLGLFPEDTEIPAARLTQLWIAEGLVTVDLQRGLETLEDAAKRCLDELVRRCILRVVRRSFAGVVKKYKLHDLLRDFCISKAKYQSFLEVFPPMDQSTLELKVSSLQARRATFHSRISLPTQNPHLRSLIRFGTSGPYIIGNIDYYEKARLSMYLVLKHFKLLRVLNLWGIETSSGKLPEEIGDLIHLRYLAMKATNIKELPKSIGNLRNLLTLDFKWNRGGGNVVFTLSNMTQLRNFYLGWGYQIKTGNFGLDKLKNLQILKGISAGNWMVREMTGLSRGIKKLEICKMSSVEQIEAVYRCPSITYDSVRTLFLNIDVEGDETLKFDLQKLENCQQLQKLTLHGRIDEDCMEKPVRFPPNVVHLVVWRSRLQRQDWITGLGKLRYLKFLHLGIDSYQEMQLTIKAGAFQQLEVLKLQCLPNLAEWSIEEGALPCLKHLFVYACRKLQWLPKELKAINTLQELSISGMPPPFCKRLGWREDDGQEGITIRNISNYYETTIEDRRASGNRLGEDFYIVQHIPTINIWIVNDELPNWILF